MTKNKKNANNPISNSMSLCYNFSAWRLTEKYTDQIFGHYKYPSNKFDLKYSPTIVTALGKTYFFQLLYF